MDFKFLSHRIRNIILNPEKTWDAIHYENKPIKYVRGSFILPLIFLVALSAFLGSLLFTNTAVSEVYSVLVGVKYFILLCIVIYGTAFIFKELSKALDLATDFNLSFKIIAYSSAPFLLCQIISRLFESFIFVNVLALYGLYIFWTGVEKMINPPENKKIPMLISATVVFIILIVVGNLALTQVMDKLYFAFFS
jgi:Yip1 domain